MANPEVRIFNERQLGNLKKMDRSLEMVQELKSSSRSIEEDLILHHENEQAFEGFYDATRTLTRKPDGGLDIAIDHEMVGIAADRLLHYGFPQFLKHQVLYSADSVIKNNVNKTTS